MRRRLRILQPNGLVLFPEASRLLMEGRKEEADARLTDADAAAIDLSDIPNADAQAPFTMVVEEYCDHHSWHEIDRHDLRPWSDDAWREKK